MLATECCFMTIGSRHRAVIGSTTTRV